MRIFNFWGTAEWLSDYDLIFPVVILYLIEAYAKKALLIEKMSLELMKYFLNAMGSSLQRQIYGTSKAKPFNAKLKAELLDAIIDYLYVAEN